MAIGVIERRWDVPDAGIWELGDAWWTQSRLSAVPGLLSEEFDVTQRQLRGNLPQAFVHALLLECAGTLAG